jgi:hypothetical protein
VLRRIFGRKRDEMTGDGRGSCIMNEKFHNLKYVSFMNNFHSISEICVLICNNVTLCSRAFLEKLIVVRLTKETPRLLEPPFTRPTSILLPVFGRPYCRV